MAKTWRPPVMMDIVEEHFDELDFLWEHREANIFTPDWTLSDLAYQEERAEAHLDGLRIAADKGRELARERLNADEPSAATAAALVLLSGGLPEDIDLLFGQLGGDAAPVVDGIRVALRHSGIDDHVDRLRELAAAENDLNAVSACDVLAFHRVASFAAARFLGSDDAYVRRLGLGALGRTSQLTAEQLASALEDPEELVRETALQEAARSQVPELAALCLAAAARATDPDPVCVRFLGVLGDRTGCGLLRDSIARPELAAHAIAGLGAAGWLENIPLLLDLMEDETLGSDAVLAYCRITGADDVEGHLPVPRVEVPEGEEEREALPPDPEKARKDWERRSHDMDLELACVGGSPLREAGLPTSFASMTLSARHTVFLRASAAGLSNALRLELESSARFQLQDIARLAAG